MGVRDAVLELVAHKCHPIWASPRQFIFKNTKGTFYIYIYISLLKLLDQNQIFTIDL